MKRARLLVLLLVAVPLLAAGVAIAGGGRLDGAAPATARFHDLDKAIAAGYDFRLPEIGGKTCIVHNTDGAMGVHMVNLPLVLDGEIDAQRPDALVYEPRPNGTLRLVALEYVVFEADWDGAEPPELFGQEFEYVPVGNRYDLPPFYALHAWIWKPNPSGLLSPWNPRVHCDGS